MERKYCYAVETVFPLFSAFSEKSRGIAGREDCTRIRMLYIDRANRVLIDYRGGTWVEDKLVGLRSETRESRSVVKETSAPHCLLGWLTLKLHLLDPSVDDLERFESLSSMDTGLFEHFSMLLKKSYKMKSRRLPTRMHETMESLSSAPETVQIF